MDDDDIIAKLDWARRMFRLASLVMLGLSACLLCLFLALRQQARELERLQDRIEIIRAHLLLEGRQP